MKYSNINYTNDVKVLGRVVSIGVDNKVAEAEQIFDTPFKYNDPNNSNIDVNKTGLDQYEINRLFRDRIYAMEAAGLIPNNETGIIEINRPVIFGNEVTISELSGNCHIKGNLNVDHKISANDIEVMQGLVVRGNTTLNGLTVNGAATFNQKVTMNNGLDVHGTSKFFDNVDIDGTLSVNKIVLAGIGDLKTYLEQLNSTISNLRSELSQVKNSVNNIHIPEAPDMSNYYTKTEIDNMINGIGQGTIDCLWKVVNGKLVPLSDGQDVATSGKFYSGI